MTPSDILANLNTRSNLARTRYEQKQEKNLYSGIQRGKAYPSADSGGSIVRTATGTIRAKNITSGANFNKQVQVFVDEVTGQAAVTSMPSPHTP